MSGDWSGGEGGGSWGGEGDNDVFTERSSQSWFSRIMGALVGIPIGLILFLGSFVLLFWNEGRAVHTAQGLAEGKAGVVHLEQGPINAADDGKLIHFTGSAHSDETLKDPVFGVSAKGIRLSRLVRMYQWKETSETHTRKKLGGGQERVTTYRYVKDWAAKPINSAAFKEPGGHQNPPNWPFEDWSLQAEKVTLGQFALSSGLVGQIRKSESVPLNQALLDALPDSVKSGMRLDGLRFYRGADPGRPEVGDMTVTFDQTLPQEVSVLGAQSGSNLAAYKTKSGTTIERLQLGVVPADAMFEQAETENRIMTWVIRAVGFVLMGVGISLVMSLATVLADFIPFLGNFVGFAAVLAAFSLAAVFSLVTIAIGWISYRPIIGISVLAAAVILLVGIVRAGRDRRPRTAPI